MMTMIMMTMMMMMMMMMLIMMLLLMIMMNLPDPVCPYAKQVAIPPSNIDWTRDLPMIIMIIFMFIMIGCC